MSEDKMRYEFEAWLFKGHDLPAQSISYTAEELLFKLWSDLKACTAIKDAEIAARDLMIKELREALHNMLEQFTKSPSTLKDSDARVKAHKALAKSEHHNSRALDKMLMEARIEALEDVNGLESWVIDREISDYKAKLAELNKE